MRFAIKLLFIIVCIFFSPSDLDAALITHPGSGANAVREYAPPAPENASPAPEPPVASTADNVGREGLEDKGGSDKLAWLLLYFSF